MLQGGPGGPRTRPAHPARVPGDARPATARLGFPLGRGRGRAPTDRDTPVRHTGGMGGDRRRGTGRGGGPFVVGVVLAVAAAWAARQLARVGGEPVVVWAALAIGVWGLAALVLARVSSVGPAWRELGVARAPWAVPWAALGGLTLAALAPHWLHWQRGWMDLSAIGLPTGAGFDLAGLSLGARLLLIAGLAAIMEELFFRGSLWSALRTLPWPARVVGAALLFAAAHGGGEGLIWALLLGCALGIARRVGGGLLAPIALHAAHNGGLLLADELDGFVRTAGGTPAALAIFGIWLAAGLWRGSQRQHHG
ncbi:MAG: CPBP family intramembrane metalloprotease [Planctomycetaceae bacterium]|nr:CPBP family intramembrane metalloprotease [Planctomycetaceae bacterium]